LPGIGVVVVVFVFELEEHPTKKSTQSAVIDSVLRILLKSIYIPSRNDAELNR
jgi:hypothetical protein